MKKVFLSPRLGGLKEKLDEIGVPCDMVFFPGANLPHGYMDQVANEPHAKKAFDRIDGIYPAIYLRGVKRHGEKGTSNQASRLAAEPVREGLVLRG